MKRLAAHVRVTVYHLRINGYMQRRKIKINSKKIQDEMDNNFVQMRAPRIKNTKRRRKAEEKGGGNGKKAEPKAKNVVR